MTPTIKAIFTDIGGVLLTNGWDQAARDRACQRFGLDAGELHERHHLTFDTYEEGKLSLNEYLERTVFFEPRDFSLADFRSFMFAQSRALPDMLDYLAAIKAKYALKVVAISNEGRELTQHRVQSFHLGSVIDTFVSSCFVHVRKPDADIFNMALDMSQVAAEEVVYLDDRPMFVDVARSLGLNGVVHKSFAGTKAEFVTLGLEWGDGRQQCGRAEEAGTIDTLHEMQESGHEQVTYFYDEASGLRAIVAIHSTRLGPALGGCRVWPYESEAAALNDVLRLSRGMTYKNAAMGLPLGGGKAVIISDSRTEKTPALFEAFGRAVERLGGRYITAEDVGTEPADMVAVNSQTKHVVGLPSTSGDPSPATAFGVFSGMKAALEHAFGNSDVRGRRVAVQGLGAVGTHLCEFLHEGGAELVVTDISQARIDHAVSAFGATAVAASDIYDVDCDVFAPCALGAVVNDDTLPRLKVRVIAGSANNQLAEARHGEALQARGIVYAPDFIINGGGVINVADELKPGGYDRDRAYAQVAQIGAKVARALKLADERGISSAAAAEIMADERLKAAG